MIGGGTHPVLGFLRRLSAGRDDAPDAELLRRFVGGRDGDAFAALVRRHGPLVFGVCVRVLGNTADAEDAFQATFVVLARRAASVGRPGVLANWLYGVARRTALKAKAAVVRRRRHEARAAALASAALGPAACHGDPAWNDVWLVLDEELSRLPDRDRAPLVLCDLEGRTHEEAARALGCPRETMTTRLVRARRRLQARLVRRGVTLSAAALAAHAALTPPALLAEAAVRVAALRVSALRAASETVPLHIAQLTEGVLHAMLLSRLRNAAALLVAAGLFLSGAGFLAHRTWSAEPGADVLGADVAGAAPLLAAAAQPAQPKQGQPKQGQPKQDRQKASVATTPPVVVKTVPQAGDTEVDAAATKEIRVTFSKDMADKAWSWTQTSKEAFPTLTGKPHYEQDKRTCVLPVKLEPGRTYVIWLNPERFQGFRDTDGRPAVFYPLVFETKP